jgi:hypothetical protein
MVAPGILSVVTLTGNLAVAAGALGQLENAVERRQQMA